MNDPFPYVDANEFSAIEKVAIAKAIDFDKLKDDGTRDQVLPGLHEVNVQVGIRGMIKVLDDTSAVARFSAPLDTALLLMLRQHMTDDEIASGLRKHLNAAHAMLQVSRKTLMDESGVTGVVDSFVAKVKAALAREPRKGSVTATLLVNRL